MRLLTNEWCAVIASWNHVYSLRWNRIVCVLECIVNQDLICTLPWLSLHIVHEATSEQVDLTSIRDASMSVTTLNAFYGLEFKILPIGPIGTRRQHGNFIVTLMILSTNQVAIIVNGANGRVLTRCRRPTFTTDSLYLRIERLSLLHSLYISLQATSQALSELIPWDVIWRRGLELLWFIEIIFLVCLQDFDCWLLSFGSGGAPNLFKSIVKLILKNHLRSVDFLSWRAQVAVVAVQRVVWIPIGLFWMESISSEVPVACPTRITSITDNGLSGINFTCVIKANAH